MVLQSLNRQDLDRGRRRLHSSIRSRKSAGHGLHILGLVQHCLYFGHLQLALHWCSIICGSGVERGAKFRTEFRVSGRGSGILKFADWELRSRQFQSKIFFNNF